MANFKEELNLLPELADHSRADLDLHRTAIEPLERLGASLGVKLAIKRDDSLTLGFGGNKNRQLEFYLGPAIKQKADTVLITGAIQSNFVRSCAAAARKLGMKPVVQLEARVPKEDPAYLNSGNVLLDRLLGADIHYFPEGENEAAADANLDALAEDLRKAGRNPYVIHLGLDHPPLGALGYASAAVETYLQAQSLQDWPDHIVVPSGSGLTHGGFLCGARAIGWDVKVHGICVRRDADQQHQRILQRAAEIDALIGSPTPVSGDNIAVYDAVLPPGYGQLNDAVHNAIKRAAHKEGLFLDPVYSGRAFAGLIDLIEKETIGRGDKVLFLHTGGLPALFGYQTDLTD